MNITLIRGMAEIDGKTWNQLSGMDYPFLRHEFLLALEQSGSVCPQTGWQPEHLLVKEGDEIIALMPLYLKSHSWGEYVFDRSWVQAYRHHGLDYYPKYLTAIPFTPCQGPRIVIRNGVDAHRVAALLLAFIQGQSEQCGLSSWHCLFPDLKQLTHLSAFNLLVREDVQFQWLNRSYCSFDDFLSALSASKRKMIKRERRKVAEQGISMQSLAGSEVSDTQWQAFFQFYAMTYRKRQSNPYLNLAFFRQLAATMPEQLRLVLAVKDQGYVGAALSFVGSDTLYGRYWGCFEDYNALHFEACYYQGIDYCIEQGLSRFDSGAQGEHKIARGFEPITTYSVHWLRDGRFAQAIQAFIAHERSQVQQYKDDAAEYLPFKQKR